jgi:hypothetical protein
MYETGSVPDENLSIEARVKNPTSVEILHLKYSLVKRIVYQSEIPHTQTINEDTIVYEGTKGTPMRNCQRDYIVKFRVPDLPASTFDDNIPLLKVKYFLVVIAVVSFQSTILLVNIKLTIILNPT